MEFYCLKCKKKKDIASFEKVINARGRPMLQSKCPDCGTKVCRMTKA